MTHFAATVSGVRYGKLAVLGEVSVEASDGQMMVILGSNGAGKSTALRGLAGVLDCDRRELVLDGKRIDSLPAHCLPRAGVALVPDGARCFPNLTILDNLRGAFVAGNGGRGRRYQVLLDEVIQLFPVLKERSHQLAGTMSGGQRQMLAVGRALMVEPRVLLLDEPSAGLAPIIVEHLFDALLRIKNERGCAIVMAEQSVGHALRVADTCLVLEEGQTVLSGPIEAVADDERLRSAYLGL